MRSCDVVVIGGGIAGVSAAARLAEQGASVVLVEAEATLAFHTTGRSAAQYLENYGNDEVRKLTLASKASLLPFLGPRPELMVGREPRVEALKAQVEHAKTLVLRKWPQKCRRIHIYKLFLKLITLLIQ